MIKTEFKLFIVIALMAAATYFIVREDPDTRDPRPSQPAPAASPWEFNIAVDVSGSMQASRKRLLGMIDVIASEIVIPRGAQINLWVFAQQTALVYGGVPGRARELWGPLDDYLNKSAPGEGTYPDCVLNEIVTDMSSNPDADHAVVLLTDGENSGDDITPLVQQLAAQSRLRAVWIMGVKGSLDDPKGDPRIRAKRTYAVLGKRLIVSGLYDRESGLKQFRALVEGSDAAGSDINYGGQTK